MEGRAWIFVVSQYPMKIEELRELKSHIDLAISIQEVGAMVQMSMDEKSKYNREFWMFDFIVGDFGVRRIRNREDMSC